MDVAPVTGPSISNRLRVAVGMSGGLDSSVAAALLVEQGHEVIGMTAHLWREGSRCCSLEDVKRAIRVAEFLKIRHYVIDSVEFFGEMIVHPFVAEYARGRTPSPCVRCNQVIKFGVLLRDALQLGCARLATGHYARVEKRDGGWHLLRGRDEAKDQSYFLHRLFQEQLARVLLPLGTWTKAEAAEYARRTSLPVPFESESQDLCFIQEDGYVPFLEKRRPDLKKPGAIVDTQGHEVGRHDGFHHFTVGQREGLGIAAVARLYVKEIRPDTNTVVVGTRDDVMSRRCLVEDTHWISGTPPADGAACTVQLRYRHRGAPATLRLREGNRTEVAFDTPEFAVTPGQAAVFYDGDDVLGGGWISTEPRADT
ncbi:MAG: tRNA 2-thiouridine(34) synthase MnmA [Verrucomicrobiota bacterium]